MHTVLNAVQNASLVEALPNKAIETGAKRTRGSSPRR